MIAVIPRGGMSSEATHCQNFSSVGKSSQTLLSSGSYLVVSIGNQTATIKMPTSISAYVIVLGDSSASITTESSVSVMLDENVVAWN